MSNSIIADHTTTFVHRLTDMREDGGASFFPSSVSKILILILLGSAKADQ